MRFSRLFALIVLVSLVSVLAPIEQRQVAAQSRTTFQIGEGGSGLAAGIGPWRTSPRGHFVSLNVNADVLAFRSVMSDRDSADAVRFEVLVNGDVAASGSSPTPSAVGGETAVEGTLPLSPGFQEVCLRLADSSNRARTVDCQDVTTTPPNRASANLEQSAQGVVVSPSGVVVPVVGGQRNNWQVTTPCGTTTTLRQGTFINRARIVIDAGHGGSESGAVSGNLQEKNLNLVVADLVVDKFEALGISTQITRTGDYRLPIGTRADIADSLAPDAFISIHHNGGALRASDTPGTEIFYSEVRPESQRLAAILYETMHAAADQFEADWVDTVNRGASVRLNDDGDDLFGIHRFTPEIDSIITEFAYLSNPSEAALLARADVQEAQAQSIVDGVMQWWFTDDSGTSLGRRFTDPTSSGTGGFDSCDDPSLTGPSVGEFGLSNLAAQGARSQ